jgi:hypothetical protein
VQLAASLLQPAAATDLSTFGLFYETATLTVAVFYASKRIEFRSGGRQKGRQAVADSLRHWKRKSYNRPKVVPLEPPHNVTDMGLTGVIVKPS